MLSMRNRFSVCSQAVVAAVFFGTAFSLPAAAEGDAARGEVLADTCEGCHAVANYNNVYPTYHVPRLAGQSEVYLAAALKLYQEGNRQHPTMMAQTASFSDQDLQDIAAWLASVGPVLETGDVNATLPAGAPEAAQVCAACHGPQGISAIPANPHLAGQHPDYILEALNQYKSGARKGPNAIAMQAQLMAVSDEDLAAIAYYYASQEGLKTLP